jgi:hypothetical protein
LEIGKRIDLNMSIDRKPIEKVVYNASRREDRSVTPNAISVQQPGSEDLSGEWLIRKARHHE